MATLADLRTQVYQRVNLSTGDATVTSTMVNSAINEAIVFIESMYDWDWLLSTHTGNIAGPSTNALAFDTTSQRIKVVYDSIGPLRHVGYSEFFTIYGSNPTAQSPHPGIFTETSSGILVYPTPSQTISVTMLRVRYSTALAADGDSPLMPAQYQTAIVEYAAYLIFRNTYQFEKAHTAFSAFENWIKIIKDNRRRVGGPRYVNAGREWSW